MQVLKYGIGIDVAKDKLDVCISMIDSTQKVSVKASSKFYNTPAGFSSFQKWWEKHAKLDIPSVFLMEATGVYYEQLAWFLHSKDKHVVVVLPNKAKKYKESLGLKSKNDKIDALGLSRMSCEQYFKPWQPITQAFYELRMITRQIEANANLSTVAKNQLHALEHGMHRSKKVEKMLRKHIEFLKKQRKYLDNLMQEMIGSGPILKAKCEKLCSIKGVGLLAVATIIAETNGFELIENQAQLVSYAGYDVVENQSGSQAGKTRISKKGNSHIRRVLHFPALGVVKYKQVHFCNLYNRVFERTRIKMKGYTAVQKKILTTLYALWKNDEFFDPYKNTPINEKEKSHEMAT